MLHLAPLPQLPLRLLVLLARHVLQRVVLAELVLVHVEQLLERVHVVHQPHAVTHRAAVLAPPVQPGPVQRRGSRRARRPRGGAARVLGGRRRRGRVRRRRGRGGRRRCGRGGRRRVVRSAPLDRGVDVDGGDEVVIVIVRDLELDDRAGGRLGRRRGAVGPIPQRCRRRARILLRGNRRKRVRVTAARRRRARGRRGGCIRFRLRLGTRALRRRRSDAHRGRVHPHVWLAKEFIEAPERDAIDGARGNENRRVLGWSPRHHRIPRGGVDEVSHISRRLSPGTPPIRANPPSDLDASVSTPRTLPPAGSPSPRPEPRRVSRGFECGRSCQIGTPGF